MDSVKRSSKNRRFYTCCFAVVLCLLIILVPLGCLKIPPKVVDAQVDILAPVNVPIASPSGQYNPSTTTAANLSGGQDTSGSGWNIGSVQINGSAPILLLGLGAAIIIWWMKRKGLITKKTVDLLIEGYNKGFTKKDIRLEALTRKLEPFLNNRVKKVEKKLAKEAKQNGKTNTQHG